MAAASTAPTTTAATSKVLAAGNGRANGYIWPDSSSERPEDTSYGHDETADDYDYTTGYMQKTGVLPYSSPNITAHFPQGKTPHSHTQDSPDFDASRRPLENVSSGFGADGASSGLPESTASAYMYEDSHHIDAGDSKKRSAATGPYSNQPDDDNSKWIHRDKLARIESEELQAAGIILPKTRARSKQRRDASTDTVNGYGKSGSDADSMSKPRSRKNSASHLDRKDQDGTSPAWDLRLPEEIAEESYFVPLGGTRSVSRIPVAKLSPVPIPQEHMERDTPMARRRDESPEESSIVYPKTRSRSASIKALDGNAAPATATSPSRNPARSTSDAPSSKKAAGAATGASAGHRKASATAKAGITSGRPRTRNGPASKETASGTGGRPVTRSGEREVSAGASSRQPEGEPPWMISAYKPDPRLPPDQQLLPTVAKRLQQEKWEREGKFGNVYDKEFRPLTDEGFRPPPAASEKAAADDTAETSASAMAPGTKTTEGEGAGTHLSEKHPGWPLKPEPRSPSFAGRAGSYSTIPKIQERPNMSPMPSPRSALPQTSGSTVVRTPAGPSDEEEAASQKGCGCCLIM